MSKTFPFLIVGLVFIQGVTAGLMGNISHALNCIAMIGLTYCVYDCWLVIDSKDETIKSLRDSNGCLSMRAIHYKEQYEIQNNLNSSLKDKQAYMVDKLSQAKDILDLTLKNI